MGLIKKYLHRIIAYGFITLGLIGLLGLFIIKAHTTINHFSYYCWLSGLLIVIGLTLLPFAKKDSEK